MLHAIFNPCKHIASCCFVRFRSLSATKIHNFLKKKIIGAEGLSRAVEYTAFISGNRIYVPFLRNALFKCSSKDKCIAFEEETEYPWGDKVVFRVKENTLGRVSLFFPAYSWLKDVIIRINGETVKIKQKVRYYQLKRHFNIHDEISIHYIMDYKISETINAQNTLPSEKRIFFGPLQLYNKSEIPVKLSPEFRIEQYTDGMFFTNDAKIRLYPIYHLMDSKIWSPKKEACQILFDY